MSNAQIQEALAIAWGAFALATWKCDAPLIVTLIAGCQCIFAMIAMVYTCRDE